MDMQNVSNLVIPEGEVRTIHDEDNRLLWGRVSYDVKYSGDTVQDGTPNPDSPVTVQTVTGEQTVSISDGNGNTQSYPISLGSTELCKLGDYQDYIYKGADGWYVYKAIEKIMLDGDENFLKSGSTSADIFSYRLQSGDTNGTTEVVSNYFPYELANVIPSSRKFNDLIYFVFSTHGSTDVAGFKAWLSTHNTVVYYILETSTDTQITDESLIAQLDAIHQFLTRYGYNAAVSGNLPIIIDKTNL